MLRPLLLLCCLLWTMPSMAATLDATAHAACTDDASCGGDGKSLTYAITVGAGTNRQLAVNTFESCNTGKNAPALTGVTYNGTSLVQQLAAFPATSRTGAIYTWPAGSQPTSGTHNIVVSLAGPLIAGNCIGSGRFLSSAVSATNIDQTTALRSTATNNGTGTALTLTIPDTGASDLVFDAVCHGTDPGTTPQTSAFTPQGDSAVACGKHGMATAPGGTSTLSWTAGTSDTWLMLGASFKDVTGGGGGGNTTYYVDRLLPGNDSNSGTSEAAPFLTIAHCVAVATNPGNTCLVKNGTYPEYVLMGASGTAGNPITLKNYPGHTPVLSFTGTSVFNAHLEIFSGSRANAISYVTVQGLELTHCAGTCIKYSSAESVILRGNYIHDNVIYSEAVLGNGQTSMMGIAGDGGGGHNIIIDQNRIVRVGGPDSWLKADAGHCIYVTGQNYIITNNILEHCNNIGIQTAGYHFTVGVNSSIGTANTNMQTFQNGLIANNTIAYTGGTGIVWWGGSNSLGGGVNANNSAYNNIFYQNCRIIAAAPNNRSCPNNVTNGMYFLNASTGFVFNNNLSFNSLGYNFIYNDGSGVYTLSGNCPATISGSCGSNPNFVNAPSTEPASADFHLQSGSTAINTGVTDANVTTDFAGLSRPQGPAYDIGAYEFPVAGGDVTAPSVPTNLAVVAQIAGQLGISWTASTDNVGVAGYNLRACTPSVCAPTVSIASIASPLTAYTYTGLADGTGFDFTVNAFDAAGNQSAYTAAVQKTTITVAAPVISNPQPSGVAVNDATPITISVNTDIPSACKYNTRTQGTPAGADNAAKYAALNNTMTISSLTASASVTPDQHGSNAGVNHFYVMCDNAVDGGTPVAGHISNVTDLTFTMIAPVDVTAPSDVTGLMATTITQTSIQLVWTAATDASPGSVSSYQVYQCSDTPTCVDYAASGNPVPATTTIIALAAGTHFNFVVKSIDSSNNYSANYSNVASAMTLSAMPAQTMTGFKVLGTYTTSILLDWDDPVTSVTFENIERCTGAACSSFVSTTYPFASQSSLLVTGLTASTTYCFRGKWADASGNVSSAYTPTVCGTTRATGLSAPRAEVSGFIARLPRN